MQSTTPNRKKSTLAVPRRPLHQSRSFSYESPFNMAAPQPLCKVVLANNIAKNLLQEVAAGIKALERPPQLHGFLANRDPAGRMYADWTAKTCKDK